MGYLLFFIVGGSKSLGKVVIVNGFDLDAADIRADGDEFFLYLVVSSVDVFAFGDFGPQEMGDDFTAELYSNGVVVDSMTYSVADYCYAVIADSSSSATLVKLAKATLNYGAAAQKYRNYKINNLVNADLSAADQSPWYAPWAAEPTVGNDSSVHAQYLWQLRHKADLYWLLRFHSTFS